ncbi:hypothetical protein JYU34_020070 [Plutella xylostella]|uniref:Uncharacterized protein n=1 Tax=Plutella xylostella TaxID=51655 RepID=A0ABQ7PVV7_PLUXY|nr:hypothetical protein JYU34_020070 [Plutella xylostella]
MRITLILVLILYFILLCILKKKSSKPKTQTVKTVIEKCKPCRRSFQPRAHRLRGGFCSPAPTACSENSPPSTPPTPPSPPRRSSITYVSSRHSRGSRTS